MLTIQRGEIWAEKRAGEFVVVGTNIGWHDTTRANNMGAGLALQVAIRFPGLSVWYGSKCRRYGADTPVILHHGYGVALFPVKPLIADDPERSWNQDASLSLIEKSARELGGMPGAFRLPLVGCGRDGGGNLDPRDVFEILNRHLDPARFRIIDRASSSLPTIGLTSTPVA